MGNPETPDSADNNLIHFEQGTLNKPNESLLSAHLEVAIRQGDIARSDVVGWLSRPWTVIDFLEGKTLSDKQVKDSVNLNFPKEMPVQEELKLRSSIQDMLEKKGLLTGLRNWAEAADAGPIKRDEWERDEKNIELKKNITEAVISLHGELVANLKVFEKTERNLKAAKGLNLVENVLRGTKEYVWDEFSEHPEMSIGLVIAGYMAIKSLKGTNLMKGLGFTAAGLVGYTFLRDKFGIRPVEKLAEMADTLGGKGVGDAMRGTADTVTRALFGDEEAGTINGYYYDKLSLKRENDTQMFNYMLGQKPKELVQWYDDATKWSVDRGGANDIPPKKVAGFAMQMEMNMEMSSHFSDMTEADKIDHMLGLTEKVFTHIAVQNDRPATSDEGLSMLKQKYIDGEYFNVKWNQMRAMEIYLEEQYFGESPEMQARMHSVVKQSQEFYKNMAIAVRRGSDEITMKHIMFLEAEPADIQSYNGPGVTAGDIGTQMEAIWKKISTEMAPGAWDATQEFLGDTVPEYWSEVWHEDVLPFLGSRLTDFEGYKKQLTTWYTEEVTPLIERAKTKGMDYIVIPVKNSKIAELLSSAGVEGGLMEIKIDEITTWAGEMYNATENSIKDGYGAFQDWRQEYGNNPEIDAPSEEQNPDIDAPQ